VVLRCAQNDKQCGADFGGDTVLVGDVSHDGEECSGGEGCVDGWRRWIGPAEVSRLNGAAIDLDGAGQCGGEQYDEEGVEAQGFAQMAVEQSGERARGAAAGAFDAKESMDGAGWIEAGDSGRIDR
jgi:hypothetical protein